MTFGKLTVAKNDAPNPSSTLPPYKLMLHEYETPVLPDGYDIRKYTPLHGYVFLLS